jgi:hypothetical protein
VEGDTEQEDLVEELSAALDEVWRLRRALAYEAAVLHATLGYKTFPKSRRWVTEDAEERMILAALGDSQIAYADVSDQSLRFAMRAIRGRQTLVRSDWRNGREEATNGRSHDL